MAEEMFQIGEVAKLYHLSVGTLRHYERVGLLAPEYVDPDTGYRYYSVRQFEQLTNIRYLRALGLPLEEIASALKDRNVDNISEALRRQKELVSRKKQELEIIERKIDRRLAQLEEANRCVLDEIQLIEQPALKLVLLRDSVKFNSYLWLEHSIRKIEQDQKLPLSYIGKVGVGISEENLINAEFSRYDLVFLVLEEEDVYEGRVDILPTCQCAAVRFRGDHGNAPAHYRKLMQYLAKNKLEIAGFSREIALVDNCISADPEQYVTEIRIPIKVKT
mgnify:CR=1 FL=1